MKNTPMSSEKSHRVIRTDGIYDREELILILKRDENYIRDLEECCGLYPIAASNPKQYQGSVVHEALGRYGRGETCERYTPLSREFIRELRKKRLRNVTQK